VPVAVEASPPLSIISPALVASSAIFSIASISSLGGGPEFSTALTIIMKRIVISPYSFSLKAGCRTLNRLNPASTITSNEKR